MCVLRLRTLIGRLFRKYGADGKARSLIRGHYVHLYFHDVGSGNLLLCGVDIDDEPHGKTSAELSVTGVMRRQMRAQRRAAEPCFHRPDTGACPA
jgi:hypothetical protein